MELNVSCLIIFASMLISIFITSIIISLESNSKIIRLWEGLIIYIFNLLIVLLLAFSIYYLGFCCG